MVKRNKNGYMIFPCPKCHDHHMIAGKWGLREHLRRVHGIGMATKNKVRTQMRRLKIRSSETALLTLTRSHQWIDKMVYILAANKSHKYKNGRSRILYIGTTKRGANRPAASAVYKASEVFYKLRGVKTIDVHIVTCEPRRAMQTWKRLESALLDAFRNKYFELPKYNKVRPTTKEGLFKPIALDEIIRKFGHD